MSGKCKRKHTEIKSKAQRGKFGAELSRARRGKTRRMKGITVRELETHLEESAGKKLPSRVRKKGATKSRRRRKS